MIAYPVLWIALTLVSSYKLSDITFDTICLFWFFFIVTTATFYAFSGVKLRSTFFIEKNAIQIPPSATIKHRRRLFEGIILAYLALLLVLLQAFKDINPEFLRFRLGQAIGASVQVPLLVIALMYFYQLSLEFMITKKFWPRFVIIIKMLIILFPFTIIGSRALLGIYLFTFIMVWYFIGNMKNWIMALFAVIGALGAAALRVRAIFMSTDAGRLNYSIANGVISSKGNWLDSVFSLFGYTVSDILYRTDMIIKYVPQKFDFLNGEGLFYGFITLLPGKTPSPYIALNHILFKGSNEDIEYPPTLVAQFYLDFGLPGVIAGAICMAIFYNYIFLKFYRKPLFHNFFTYIVFSFYFLLSVYGALQLIYIVLIPVFSIIILSVLGKRENTTFIPYSINEDFLG